VGGTANATSKLRAARLRLRWTEEDIAVRLHQLAARLGEQAPGVDANQVSKWERGVRSPGRYYKPRLCLVFELTPEELGWEPTPRLLQDIGDLRRRLLERPPDVAVAAQVERERLAATIRHLWPVDRTLLAGLARMRSELAALHGDRRGLAAAVGVRERQLGRWRTDPAVRELDEAIRRSRALPAG